ncbi:hypothetical protein SRABI04_02305 [Chryseobacterium sp. Bi04]|nr:hypothetical protein SRABI04_02305 [Chryseobacterium sp. Bi04]
MRLPKIKLEFTEPGILFFSFEIPTYYNVNTMKNLKKISRMDLKKLQGGAAAYSCGSYCSKEGEQCGNYIYECYCQALNGDPTFLRCVPNH